ncbi:hypothetical protein [Streptomyces phaeochromogenes]|uniref:hypothetical protein n=1 Tax=Streptomyces phaeochromogenes TaxID=1923 RepID=UPI002E0ECBE7|nr:hypothetical protein OG437_23415 [Streptomyces phaeochromogenes]WSS95291.1 hypothetical protein OG478_28000 [Streptomyces phaeochromogenes]WSW15707.1 hypothetical protein OG277_23460 [Streptomyces phaeochromogenes]WTA05781.1 hypothetical protein OHB08_27570 [Streptomyces phaeochromogenes]
MAMVGLFWIAEGDVYVGAKPSGRAPGVRLTPEGVVSLGDGSSDLWPWDEVRGLTVEDVPLKTLKRRISVMVDMVLTVTSFGETDAPPMMSVFVETADGTTDLTVYAAASSYSQEEYDLSLSLLSHLTAGEATLRATLAAMAQWGRAQEDGSPRAAEREGLLREWVGVGSLS